MRTDSVPAVHAVSNHSFAVRGENTNNIGGSISRIGVWGVGRPGVSGFSANGVGIEGSGFPAGLFFGDVRVTGTLSKAGGQVKIDHPLDPAHRYLCHSFIESDEMKNVYDGIVQLDADSEAEVQLPDWCNALNQRFRYQLTPISYPAPDLHIAQQV